MSKKRMQLCSQLQHRPRVGDHGDRSLLPGPAEVCETNALLLEILLLFSPLPPSLRCPYSYGPNHYMFGFLNIFNYRLYPCECTEMFRL